jgi:DNA anti-recombination protein RmuC
VKKVWPWIVGIVVGLIIVALLLGMRSNQQAYRVARGEVNSRVAASKDRIDTVVEMATAAVDLALEMAGNLPSQQAKADLVKQDIEEIGNRLKDASEARGEAAVEKLHALSDQFDQTLQTVEDASQEATSPAAKSILDRIYGVLEAVQEQITQAVLERYE